MFWPLNERQRMSFSVTQIVWFIFIGIPTAAAVIAASWKVFHAVSKWVAWMDSHGPVLIQIAEQFKPNHGSSLYDRLEAGDNRMGRIENSIESIRNDVSGLRCVRERGECDVKP